MSRGRFLKKDDWQTPYFDILSVCCARWRS